MIDSSKFGLVGVGTMGRGLTRNMTSAGIEVSAFDIDSERLSAAREVGARPVNGIGGVCAASDIVGICLPSVAAIRDVFEGSDGLLAEAREGQIIVDFSTSDPNLTREMSARAAETGVTVVDAPMLRSEDAAWAGTLVLLVGGPEEAVEACRPAFAAVSENFIHCGGVGTGHTFKLLNNVNGISMHAAYSETFVLAKKLGLNTDKLLQVLRSGLSGSTILEAMTHRILDDNHEHQFAIDVALKDVTLFCRLAADSGTTSVMGDATRHLMQLTSLAGYGDDTMTRVGTALAGISGVNFGGGGVSED